jgi:hypothetical protein
MTQSNFYAVECGRSPAGDQLHNGGIRQQRLPSPVPADEREQPMLDLVPLAGTRRQVTYLNP